METIPKEIINNFKEVEHAINNILDIKNESQTMAYALGFITAMIGGGVKFHELDGILTKVIKNDDILKTGVQNMKNMHLLIFNSDKNVKN